MLTLRLRHTLAALCVAAMSLLAFGCGEDGPSKDAYEDGLRRVQRQLAAANESSRESGETTDQAARTAKLEKAHEQIAAAARTAGGLEPPDDARAAHRKLAKALDDYATLFQQLASLEPDEQDESELYSRAGEIVDQLGEANRELDELGYEVDAGKDGS